MTSRTLLNKKLLPVDAALIAAIEHRISLSYVNYTTEITSIRSTDFDAAIIEFTSGYHSTFGDHRWCETDRLAVVKAFDKDGKLSVGFITDIIVAQR